MSDVECSASGCTRRAKRDDLCGYHAGWRARGWAGPAICLVEGCDAPARRKGRCMPHHDAWRRTEGPGAPCSVPGCGRPRHSRGLCHSHHVYYHRTGVMPTGPLKSQRPIRRQATDSALARGELTPFEIGLVIALTVGEGTFTSSRRRPMFAIGLSGDEDRQVLEHLQRLIGGRVYGPYRNRAPGHEHWLPFWRLHVENFDLRLLVPLMAAWLPTSRKRAQFEEWRARHRL